MLFVANGYIEKLQLLNLQKINFNARKPLKTINQLGTRKDYIVNTAMPKVGKERGQQNWSIIQAQLWCQGGCKLVERDEKPASTAVSILTF